MQRNISMWKVTFYTLLALSAACFTVWFFTIPDTLTYQAQSQEGAILPAKPTCDPTLWKHVYAGDTRRFATPQDRLKVIKDCVTVTGTIETAVVEADGDFHIRLKLDPQYKSMLNTKNISGQRGDLVLEPVCENPVKQADTLKEGACTGYQGHVYNKPMLGKHVQVTGAFVTDMEHGWQEIHPVTSIH